MNPIAENVQAEIWARVIDPDDGSFTPDVAKSILRLGFKDSDIARMNELSEKVQSGTLTTEEQIALDGYERIGGLLNVLQAKARLSLKKAGLEPE